MTITSDLANKILPKCPKCGTFVQPTNEVLVWECPNCKWRNA